MTAGWLTWAACGGARAHAFEAPESPGTQAPAPENTTSSDPQAVLRALRAREVAPDAPGRWREGLASRRYSVAGSLSDVRLAGQVQRRAAATLRQDGRAYLQLGLISARYTDFAIIGYGGAGLEGGVGADLAMGIRLPVAEDHGPVARLGVRGHLMGSDLFYSSALELPQVQLGYQWLTSDVHLELFGRGSYVLTGRFRPEGARRDLGGTPLLGAAAALGFGPWHLELGWDRIQVRDNLDRGVQRLRGETCLALAPLGICVQATHERGDAALVDSASLAHVTYIGVSVGLVDASRR